MAGQDTKGHPAGTKAGDVLHVFQSGSIQMITDVSIDPAVKWQTCRPNPKNSLCLRIFA
jgi:hypothetical protein